MAHSTGKIWKITTICIKKYPPLVNITYYALLLKCESRTKHYTVLHYGADGGTKDEV